MAQIKTIHTDKISYGHDSVNILIGLTIEDEDENETYEATHCLTPDDRYGFSPYLRQWLIDNEGNYTITPYVAPVLTPEEIRAQLPNLTARQFWMAAAMINIDKDVIIATVKANMEDSIDRKIVLAELETSTFERKSETIAEIMAMLGIPDDQVDTLWVWAAGI